MSGGRAAGACLTLALLLPASALGAPMQGGAVRQLGASDVDWLDPGQTYYTLGFQVQSAISRTLYSHRPDQQLPVPDLAAGPPELSADLKTITVRIRPGVRFAPPVNREVVAGDVKYAIERAFSRSVFGQYTTYFEAIVGTPRRFPKHPAAISGIETPDDRTLVLRLRRPEAVGVAAALVIPITTPVPKEVARARDRVDESTYNDAVVATGPYRVSRFVAGQELTLTRNPNWDPATDFRPAYLDRITLDFDNRDDLKSARRVAAGSGLLFDSGTPVVLQPSLPAELMTRVSSGGTRIVAFNTRSPRLRNVNLRRGITAGLDRIALRRARGGAAAGQVATHFLPPGMPGFEEAGGIAGTGADFLASPGGDRALARRYLKKGGFRRGMRLSVVGANAEPGRAVALSLDRQLRRLGFRTRLRLVPQDDVYTEWCMPRRADICANAGWFKDFTDPESMLSAPFGGVYGADISGLRAPALRRAIVAARAVPSGPQRFAAWAQVDRKAMALAPVVPYLWDETALLRSRDVEAAADTYSTTWNLSFTALRAP